MSLIGESITSFLYKDQLFSDRFYIIIENFGFACAFAKENDPIDELCSIVIKKLETDQAMLVKFKYCQK